MKQKEYIVSEVEDLVTPVVEGYDMEVVAVEWKNQKGRWILCVYIDKPDGITIDDCENISYEISDLLDRTDVIDHHYTLEVSSPGLERPLRKIKDFKRFTGEPAHITTSEPLHGQKKFKGWLQGVDGQNRILFLLEQNKEEVTIPVDQVSKANLRFEPEPKNKKGGMKKSE